MSDSFIFEATRENFQRLVIENSNKGLVLVDFWSPRAGPSLRQREILTALAKDYRGRFLLVTVNTDEQGEISNRYGVHSIPSMKLFYGGNVVREIHGVQPRADYRRILDQQLAESTGPALSPALKAWRTGREDRAIQRLADAAMADPGNPAIPRTLVKMLMRQNRHRDARAILLDLPAELRSDEVLNRLGDHLEFIVAAKDAPPRDELEETVENDPGNEGVRFRLASVYLVSDEYDQAIEQLLFLARNSPEFGKRLAEQGYRVLLDILDHDDERLARFRSGLSEIGSKY